MSPRPTTILIAEDDPKTSQLLSVYLAREGFEVRTAYDGASALAEFRSSRPDFVILDVMLPLVDGWEVCRQIRRDSETPILFLTARDEESDRLLGLGLGADDYVVKPFSPKEVVARVKGIFRRTDRSGPQSSASLRHGPLEVDLDRRRVKLGDDSIALTPLEYALLTTLMAAPGRVFLRDELISRLYPRGEVVIDRVIDVHIGKLRQKIEVDPTQPRMILTVRGVGYHFADQHQEGPH